jgi:tRNA dimethylallyltransferase
MNNPLIVIAGPTASGKSALAMQIAKKYNGELICADSRTVYKGMDIGTAKPSQQDRKEIRHHLLDVVEPNDVFTAADFKECALEAIAEITARGKLPIMVGGTGLYIDAVIFDYQFGDRANPGRRAELQAMSVEQLQQMCLMEGISLPTNTKNKRHLIRAIEIHGLINHKKTLRPNTLVVALTTDRDNLRSRIQKRAEEMVAEGVLDEVKHLGEQFGWSGEALTGNIYRVFKPVVEGNLSIQEGIEHSVTSDMQLAKRQVTWLKRNPYVVWGNAEQLRTVIEHFVQQNKLTESIPEPL